MTLEPSAWRANDAVRFDVAREALNRVTATLFELVDRGVLDLDVAVSEARDRRLELLAIDGFQRHAIDSFIEMLDERIAGIMAGER
ncbi:hypothetical protein [Microbacterium sp.]|uniref:hypothetical protein n=1 Tax=Microbacterium sp. TaxID=51671 RepID=UPI003C18F347